MWLTQSGKSKAIAKAASANVVRRGRRPDAMSVLVIAIVGWVAVWAAASVYYSLRPSRSRLRFSKGTSCWFESRGYGYLDSRGGDAFAFLDEARSACISSPTCLGITITPWDGKYVLKTSAVLVETFDGQKSLLKKCVGDKGVPEEAEVPVGEEERPAEAGPPVDLAHWEPLPGEDGGEEQDSGAGGDEGDDASSENNEADDSEADDSEADDSEAADKTEVEEEEDGRKTESQEEGDKDETEDSLEAATDDDDAADDDDDDSDNASDAEPDNADEQDDNAKADNEEESDANSDRAENDEDESDSDDS